MTAPPDVHQQFNAAPKSGTDGKVAPDLISSWESVRTTGDIAALNSFINRFPDSQFTDAAWDRLNQLIQGGALKVAGQDVGLDIISTVLQHKKDASSNALRSKRDASSGVLRSIVSYYDLSVRYPLGFALFYSDGNRILYSGDNIDQTSTFDPSRIRVTSLNESRICFTGFEWHGEQTLIMDNDCFGGPPGTKANIIRMGKVIVSYESLGASPHGAAWIIGLHN